MKESKKELEDLIKEINSDDLKEMFGTYISSVILSRDLAEVGAKLEEYIAYKVPVALGDVIEMNEKKYTVTCIYTDNMVDLLSENATKNNVGLYKKDVKVVGKLQCVNEEV